MTQIEVLDAPRDRAGGYKVDASRGQRIGRVSSEWFSRPADERYLSLSALMAAVKGRAERSRTRTVESAAIRVEARRDDGERLALILPGSDMPVAPTHWSFGQLASLVGAPAAYLRQLPAPLAGINLQYGLTSHRAEQVKTLETEDGRVELRAVTGPDYGRIADLVDGDRPATLYLVVPPSDISRTKPLIRLVLNPNHQQPHHRGRRTKPLIRLVLNQIGRRLTEDLQARDGRHRLLLMLDEFPALGRLDFFESALAFMAGYGIKGFLIAQSLNQIEKAYGPNNAILDNCHVRVSFATNDERTAKRVSDALGTATEMRAMKNYAGHRLSPWLGHLMVSRSETARQLLTPGEIMQLPPDDEIVMVAGVQPMRAKKMRYFTDRRFTDRVLAPPDVRAAEHPAHTDDWSKLAPIAAPTPVVAEPASDECDDDAVEGGIRREPEIDRGQDIAPEPRPAPTNEFDADEPDGEDADAVRARVLAREQRMAARRAALDPNDGIEL